MTKDKFAELSLCLLPALIALTFLAIVVSFPLSSSFWLDETLTYWVIKDSFHDLISRSYEYQGQSPLYFVCSKIIKDVFGGSEFALRMPSLLAALGTIFFTYSIGRLLCDRESGLLAGMCLLCVDGFVKSALTARPYALALLCTTASIYFLLRWLSVKSPAQYQREPILPLSLYITSTLAAFYVHYLFAAVILVHAALLISSGVCWRRIVNFWCMLAAFLALLASVPGLSHFLSLSSRTGLYFYASLPSVVDFGKALIPAVLFIAVATGLGVARIYGPITLRAVSRFKTWCFLIGWAVLPQSLLFLYSHLSGSSLFFWRFYLWAAPAIALLAALLVRSLEPKFARAVVALTLFLLLLLVPRVWILEDWRAVAQIIHTEQAKKPGTRLLVYSGLVELDHIEWLRDPARREFLLAPFQAYSAPFPMLLLPSGFYTPAAKEYFDEQILPILREESSFILVSARMSQLSDPLQENILPDYFVTLYARYGFAPTHLLNSGLVRVVRFERGDQN